MRRSVLTLALAVTVLLGLLPVAPAPAQEAPEFRALVFSKTNGFRHESIEAGNASIERLGAENDFTVDVTEDSAVFTDENLAQYDVVVFNNTNSRNGAILDAEQRAAFERYIQAGGGFTGIHSASGTEYDWAWYGDLLGAFFKVHPPIQEVAIEVDDDVHPSTQHLPQRWVRTEEPYDFVKNVRGEVHVLASFDEQSYNGATMGADHPSPGASSSTAAAAGTPAWVTRRRRIRTSPCSWSTSSVASSGRPAWSRATAAPRTPTTSRRSSWTPTPTTRSTWRSTTPDASSTCSGAGR